MIKSTDILKGVLLLRRFNRSTTKEEQIAELKEWAEKEYFTEKDFYEWIDSLKVELKKTPEQREEESRIACEEMAEQDAEWEYEHRHTNSRDEWDDLWDDRAKSVGATWF